MSSEEVGLILSNFDAPIPLQETASIFEKIDRIIADGIRTKNGWVVIDSCKQLYEIARLSSISLAKFLYEIISNWDKLGINEDVYAVLNDRLGVHRNTINRYAEAWQTLPQIPEEYREDVIKRGIADILKVTKMLNSGFEPDEEQWSGIVNAPCRTDLEEAIRDVTKEPVSEKMIYPVMEIDGTINVYHLGEKHYVGKLETASGEYAVQKTIYRMTVGGGVSRK